MYSGSTLEHEVLERSQETEQPPVLGRELLPHPDDLTLEQLTEQLAAFDHFHSASAEGRVHESAQISPANEQFFVRLSTGEMALLTLDPSINQPDLRETFLAAGRADLALDASLLDQPFLQTIGQFDPTQIGRTPTWYETLWTDGTGLQETEKGVLFHTCDPENRASVHTYPFQLIVTGSSSEQPNLEISPNPSLRKRGTPVSPLLQRARPELYSGGIEGDFETKTDSGDTLSSELDTHEHSGLTGDPSAATKAGNERIASAETSVDEYELVLKHDDDGAVDLFILDKYDKVYKPFHFAGGEQEKAEVIVSLLGHGTHVVEIHEQDKPYRKTEMTRIGSIAALDHPNGKISVKLVATMGLVEKTPPVIEEAEAEAASEGGDGGTVEQSDENQPVIETPPLPEGESKQYTLYLEVRAGQQDLYRGDGQKFKWDGGEAERSVAIATMYAGGTFVAESSRGKIRLSFSGSVTPDEHGRVPVRLLFTRHIKNLEEPGEGRESGESEIVVPNTEESRETSVTGEQLVAKVSQVEESSSDSDPEYQEETGAQDASGNEPVSDNAYVSTVENVEHSSGTLFYTSSGNGVVERTQPEASPIKTLTEELLQFTARRELTQTITDRGDRILVINSHTPLSHSSSHAYRQAGGIERVGIRSMSTRATQEKKTTIDTTISWVLGTERRTSLPEPVAELPTQSDTARKPKTLPTLTLDVVAPSAGAFARPAPKSTDSEPALPSESEVLAPILINPPPSPEPDVARLLVPAAIELGRVDKAEIKVELSSTITQTVNEHAQPVKISNVREKSSSSVTPGSAQQEAQIQVRMQVAQRVEQRQAHTSSENERTIATNEVKEQSAVQIIANAQVVKKHRVESNQTVGHTDVASSVIRKEARQPSASKTSTFSPTLPRNHRRDTSEEIRQDVSTEQRRTADGSAPVVRRRAAQRAQKHLAVEAEFGRKNTAQEVIEKVRVAKQHRSNHLGVPLDIRAEYRAVGTIEPPRIRPLETTVQTLSVVPLTIVVNDHETTFATHSDLLDDRLAFVQTVEELGGSIDTSGKYHFALSI